MIYELLMQKISTLHASWRTGFTAFLHDASGRSLYVSPPTCILQVFVRVIIPPPQDLEHCNMHSTKMISIRNPENHDSNLNQGAGSIFFYLGFLSKYKLEITHTDEQEWKTNFVRAASQGQMTRSETSCPTLIMAGFF